MSPRNKNEILLQEVAMNDGLTKDEYDALDEINSGSKPGRASACVARNSKRLTGLKFLAYGKDGSLALTEKGQQTLFLKRCIDGLRAISTNPFAPLAADVATFLGKKGHIARNAAGDGYEMTQRGTESLADIDATAR